MGKKKLHIWNPSGTEEMQVESEPDNVQNSHGEGKVKDLILRDSNGNDHEITKIPDDLIIETRTKNPGNCRWFFLGGSWYYI